MANYILFARYGDGAGPKVFPCIINHDQKKVIEAMRDFIGFTMDIELIPTTEFYLWKKEDSAPASATNAS